MENKGSPPTLTVTMLGDCDDMKSNTGYVFLLASRAVSWFSKKQPIVILSITEAEFIVAAKLFS